MSSPWSIQPIGFHLGLSADWTVSAVSSNIGEFLERQAGDLLGQPITALFSDDAIHDMRNRLALLRGEHATEYLYRFPLASDGEAYDVALYRSGDGFAIDAELGEEQQFGDFTGIVLGMVGQIDSVGDMGDLCEQAARQLRALTGFERVMVCGDGRLLGLSSRDAGQRFDHVAMPMNEEVFVADLEAERVPILTEGDAGPPATGSTLRSPTEAEVHSLAALGARAALILPLRRGGRVWGHVGGYHPSSRHISAERRNVARLFARILSLKIELEELRVTG